MIKQYPEYHEYFFTKEYCLSIQNSKRLKKMIRDGGYKKYVNNWPYQQVKQENIYIETLKLLKL